ncbi:putative transporter mfs2-like protein 2 [Colletotrichum chlorophyti]|uniref:Putative transporter mfs2-like protein 2 n=1 Tax=Colletotrichum chlorophyti TaxID=708187 RepID=A0A1Q8RX63_9PEZI|nr:putative transporter mfs2-like protein 2 [Colletotrichum chlorophyti]
MTVKDPELAMAVSDTTRNIRVVSQNGYGCDTLVPESSNEISNTVNNTAQDLAGDFVVGWDGGDNDSLYPRNWATVTKWAIVLVVSAGSFCVSIYSATNDQVDTEFHSSRIISTLGLSAFVMGIALGPLISSPLSEFYGRRPIYLLSYSLFIIWTIPSAVARNIQTIIVARLLAGAAGSAFLSVSGGTVGDLFNHDELQAPMSINSLAPFIGPSIGPLLGGFINFFTTWRWTYYILIIWGFAQLVALVVLVPETYRMNPPNTFLYRRSLFC